MTQIQKLNPTVPKDVLVEKLQAEKANIIRRLDNSMTDTDFHLAELLEINNSLNELTNGTRKETC